MILSLAFAVEVPDVLLQHCLYGIEPVIRGISGVPTASSQAFVQAAAALTGAEEVVLEIDRGGSVVTYRYRTGP